jgi:hypothetical protein
MEDDDRQFFFGHYQDGHLTLLVKFPLPVLQGALPVMGICWLGNQHIYVGYCTKKFMLPVTPLMVPVRVSVLVL